MGGSGSGRPGYYGCIEGRLQLDVRQFRRKGWLYSPMGSLTWHRDGEPFASAQYSTQPGEVQLHYQTRDDDGNPLPVSIRVPVTTSPCRYGGHRHYWQCPHCGRRCEVIVSGWGGRGWGCRKCLRLRYRCQALAPHWRYRERADKIYRALGGDDDFVPKPKWMRWRTFHRLMDKADALAARGDRMAMAGLAARFGMPWDD